MSDLLRSKYDFKWDVIEVIIGGRSILDSNFGLTGFPMSSIEDADRFMRSYGFNLDDPIERAEAQGNFHEALNFVRKHFLQPDNSEGLKLEIPRRILEITDIRDLLLMASLSYPGQTPDTPGNLLKDWACSLLKVVHTIAHLDKDVRYSYFTEIQQQIFDRFYKAIHRDTDGNLFLAKEEGDPQAIALVAFETKPKKSRESILLKLLHKQESVADDIFDQVGIRFVTPTRLDALRVVKYLKDTMILMPANIKPSRSRNTLFDLDIWKSHLSQLLNQENLSEEDLYAGVENLGFPESKNPDNPHSSDGYRAIQFTSRQLIKLKDPLYENVKQLKGLVKEKKIDEEVAETVDRIDLKYLQREVRFFYPYEIQIVDQKSHEQNEAGQSAHSEYKRSQIRTALSRIMGNLAGHPDGGRSQK